MIRINQNSIRVPFDQNADASLNIILSPLCTASAVQRASASINLAAVAGHIDAGGQLGGIDAATHQVVVLDGTVVVGSNRRDASHAEVIPADLALVHLVTAEIDALYTDALETGRFSTGHLEYMIRIAEECEWNPEWENGMAWIE